MARVSLALVVLFALELPGAAQQPCSVPPDLVDLGQGTGSADLLAVAPEVAGELGLVVRGGEPNALGCVLVSEQRQPIFLPVLDLTLIPSLARSFVVSFQLDRAGNAVVVRAADIPADNCGRQLFTQAVLCDSRVPSGAVSTNALQLRVGQVQGSPRIIAPTAVPVELGDRAQFAITATDVDGSALPVMLQPLPLPRNACYDSTTGDFEFVPDETQVGVIEVEAIAVGQSSTTRRVLRFVVSQRAQGSPTEISGRVLDSSTQAPIPGVTVRIPGTALTVSTDSSGAFSIGPVPRGARVIELDGMAQGWTFVAEDINLLLGRMLIDGANNVIHRPVFLPALGMSAGQIDPNQMSMLSNPGIGVQVMVEPNSARVGGPTGPLFTGNMFMPEVEREFTPAALPDTLEPGLVIAIQPAGLVFDPPAPITFPNRSGLPTGSEVNIWSINPISGEFEIVATGTVDGSVIRSNPGEGIRNSSWHFAEPGGPDGCDDGPGPNDCVSCPCAGQPGSSFIAFRNGNLLEDHSLVTYQSVGQERGLRMVYNSRAATASPVIGAELSLHRRFASPAAFSLRTELGGLMLPEELFFEAPPTNDRAPQKVAFQVDGSPLVTGFYPYRMRITSNYVNAGTADQGASLGSVVSRVGSDIFGGVVVQNNRTSPMGCGWSIDGIQRLSVQADDRVVIDEGGGRVIAFRRGVRSSPGLVMETFNLQSFSELQQGFANRPPELFQVTDAFTTQVVDRYVISEVNFPDTAFDVSAFFSVGPNGSIDAGSTATAPVGDDRSIQPAGGNDLFGAAFTGILEVPTGGDITFRIGVDDGFAFYLDGQLIGSFFGGTDFRYFTFTATNVPAGFVPIRLDYAESGGEADIVFEARGAGLPGGVVPERFLRTALPSGTASLEFASPPGEFSTLRQLVDGTFERRMTDGTRYLFDAEGLLRQHIDRNGNTTTYEYTSPGGSPANALSVVRDPVGLETRLVYQNGLLARIEHPGSAQPTMFRHQGTDLVRITDPDGTSRSFGYDSAGRMTSQRDKRGFETTYDYGGGSAVVRTTHVDTALSRSFEIGSVAALVANPAATSLAQPAAIVRASAATTSVTNRRGETSLMELDRLGGFSALTDPLQRTTGWARDVDGLVTQMTLPNGRVEELSYDCRGNLLTRTEAVGVAGLERTTRYRYLSDFSFVDMQTDPAGHTTVFAYDPNNGDLLSITDPEQGVQSFTYDARGQVATSTDQNGNVTQFTYDALGRLRTVTDALMNVTRYERDGRGNIERIVEGVGTPEERAQRFTYDALNRVRTSIDGAGATTTFDYDGAGNLTSTTLPTGEAIIREYDSMGRLDRLVDPLRGATRFTYDGTGNLCSRTDALNRTTTFVYDAANQLERIVDPLGGIERYSYDANGNVDAFTNARDKTTAFAFDVLDRRTSMQTPEQRVRQWGYDSRDNLTTEVQPGPITIVHSYDALSRRTRTDVPAVGGAPGNVIDLTYDPVGNLRTVVDNDTRLERTYDALNRVREERTLAGVLQPVTTITSFYNAVGDRTMLADSEGGSHTYGHDGVGRLTSVVTPEVGRISMGYDPSGRIRTVSYPNGITGSYDYQPSGRLSRITHAPSSGPALVSLSYQIGATGNIEGIDDASIQKLYGYDPLDRLTTATEIAPATYAYDPVGNRTQSDSTSTAAHNDDNQLLSDDTGTYRYDPRGNLSSYDETGAPPPQVYLWDGQNQLVEATGVSQYRYDGLGRRVEKVVGSITRRYVYDGDNILLEFDGGNQLLARYTHGEQVDQHLAMARGGAGFYYHTDHLGSVRSVTDAVGAEVNRYRYDPYGRVVGRFEAIENPFWYSGREEASEIGWYYYRARWYQSRNGRFVSEDPEGYQATTRGEDDNEVGSSPLADLLSGRRDGSRNSAPERPSAERKLFVPADLVHGSISTYQFAENNPATYTDNNGRWVAAVGRAIAAAWARARPFINKAIKECKRVRCKLELHGPHHHFGWPFNERRPHVQLTCWRVGVKGSTFIVRIPY